MRHRADTTTLHHVIVATALLAACSAPPVGWDDSPIDTDVATPRFGVVGGIVSDTSGAPVAGAHVTTVPHGVEADTDAAGRYTLARLDPGTYTLVFAAGGVTVEIADVVVLESGTEVDAVLPDPPTGGGVRVHADGPDGTPLVGAIARASSGEEAVTDDQGDADLEGLADGTVSVVVADAEGALWPRTVDGLEVRSGTRTGASVRLAGRAAPGSIWVGTPLCSACHPDQGDAHAGTRHAHALATTVVNPFRAVFAADTTVPLDHGTARLFLDGGVPTVEIDTGRDERRFPVAGVIGDARSGSVPFTDLDDQAFPLPIAWRAADDRFPGWPDAAAAVVPWEQSTWLGAGGFTFAEGSRPSPSLSAEARCIPCHATGFRALPRSDGGVDLEAVVGTARWGESGVGCERCHGPGSSHRSATEDATRKRLVTRPDLLDAERANEVCAQCHSRVVGVGATVPYPLSVDDQVFHSGEVLADFASSDADLWPSGAAASPGSQADELAVSPHGTAGGYEARCFDCHDPHGASTDAGGAALPSSLRLDVRDNALCSSCHLRLSFAGDESALEKHWNHSRYDPTGASMRGRCTECHMPETAARVGFHDGSGAGDLASHLFLTRPPQDAIDAFEAVRLSELPLGSFPTPPCARCHAWNTFLFGGAFPGPTGDLTQLDTLRGFQRAYEEKFP